MAESPSICPACSATLAPGDYFCPDCGKKLRDKPPSTSAMSQAVAYLVSLFLPPFGLWYVWKYLKWPDGKLRTIGIIALVITVISTVFAVWLTIDFINAANQYANSLIGL